MAEIAIKIGDQGPGEHHYKDGDILCAFSDRHIKHVHAQMICDVRAFGFTSEGLRHSDTLAEKYLSRVSQYMFERISATEVRRTNLIDLSVDIFSSAPNEKGEAIDVALFLSRRISHPGHKIFGTSGSERWYGGNSRFEETIIDSVWDDIETGSDEVRSAYTLWPAGYNDVRSHLLVRTTNFTEAEVQQLVSPRYEVDQDGNRVVDADGNEVVLAKRNVYTNWRNLLADLSVSEAKVLDKRNPVGKEVVLPRQAIGWASKDQPKQTERALLGNKSQGRAPV